jgi:hypothetical protein
LRAFIMRILNLLSRVAPVLVCLAPPTESSGGGSTEDAPPAWAPPATEPVATGDTLEAKLTSAASHIKTFFTNLGLALAAFTKLQGDYKSLDAQFNELKETARLEKEEHGKTKGLLTDEKAAHTVTSGKLLKAEANVGRLESLCDLKGIDKNQVVAPAAAADLEPQTADDWNAKLAAAKSTEEQHQVLADFQKAVKDGKVKKA